MNGIKDFPRPLPRDHWTRLARGDVTEDGAVIKLDIVEAKASDGVLYAVISSEAD